MKTHYLAPPSILEYCPRSLEPRCAKVFILRLLEHEIIPMEPQCHGAVEMAVLELNQVKSLQSVGTIGSRG